METLQATHRIETNDHTVYDVAIKDSEGAVVNLVPGATITRLYRNWIQYTPPEELYASMELTCPGHRKFDPVDGGPITIKFKFLNDDGEMTPVLVNTIIVGITLIRPT